MIGVLLRSRRGATIAWAVGIFLFGLLIGIAFQTISTAGDGAAYDELVDGLPDAVKEAFGGVGSLSTVEGFIRVEVTSYLPLVFSVLAISMASKSLAAAQETGLLDHLLARPVTRTRYYSAAFIAHALELMILHVAGMLGVGLGLLLSGVEVRTAYAAAFILLEMYPLVFCFLGVGMLAGALASRNGLAMGVGISLLVASFLVALVGRIWADGDLLQWVTPFGYMDRSDWFHGELDLWYVAFCTLVGGAAGSGGLLRFTAKDL